MGETYLDSITSEQIRRFISGDRSFFDSKLIESVSRIVFGKCVDPEASGRITDVVLTFASLCKKYAQYENRFGEIVSLDAVDRALIQTIHTISAGYMATQRSITPNEVYAEFRKTFASSQFKMFVEADPSMATKIQSFIESTTIDSKQIEDTQVFIENKIAVVDVLEQIESYTSFLETGAMTCTTLDDFVTKFSRVVNDASASLSNIVDVRDDEGSLSDALHGSFFKEIIANDKDRLKCGINIIDAVLGGGFDKARVTMFAGKTGGGKSTMLINVAYGMLKTLNGMYFSEIDILQNDAAFDMILSTLKKYVQQTRDAAPKRKKLILYVTLENMKTETIKRILCRMGLMPNIIWTLLGRDHRLAEILTTKGFKLTRTDLPPHMEEKLATRIINMCSLIQFMLHDGANAELKVVWQPPMTITSYNLFLLSKKYERMGYDVMATFVDYPDKMRAIDTGSKAHTDQNWLELGTIIDNLKTLSKQIEQNRVICVTQVNREANKGDQKVLKGGATSGSIHKEYNTDTYISLAFKSDDDLDLETQYKEFKMHQHVLYSQRRSIFNQLISSGDDASFKSTERQFNAVMQNMLRSSDIITMRLGVPKIAQVASYVTKNRDGVNDLTFELHIVYGMYMITDSFEEALESAKYATETYAMLVEYMYTEHLIGGEAYQMCRYMVSQFMAKYNEQKMRCTSQLDQSVSTYRLTTNNAMRSMPTTNQWAAPISPIKQSHDGTIIPSTKLVPPAAAYAEHEEQTSVSPPVIPTFKQSTDELI